MLRHSMGVFVAVAAALWLLPAQLNAFVAYSTGCYHNGTWYADKSLVPTMEKCLNCQCMKKSLVCRMKVCPEMPMPPPRGCVVVQKKSNCCPYLSCARLQTFYGLPITRRIIQYLDHYERESIDRVVNENMLQRRSDDSEVDTHVCVKNGTVYKSGSAMSSSNLCTYCYCIGGTEKCVKPKCMLPLEGCKPIFVDSTCCPVRYDCSSKTSGKSSQEVRYRKTSNKHFLRMTQRLQRNRGCTTDEQFYTEGQKMKSDADKPCDMCFCIRGSRRCSQKKCAPPLKNCLPVVPKGQCCPSSYDCGSQRDYRRANNSRQFNLFSLLFGKEDGGEGNATDLAVQYPHDRDPAITAPHDKPEKKKPSSADDSNEKSIFDTIREGLEFIDNNNDKLLEENLDLIAMETVGMPLRTEVTSAPDPPLAPATKESSSTEVSFLDLILGASEPSTEKLVHKPATPPPIPTDKTGDGVDEPSWLDVLLGVDDENVREEGKQGITEISTLQQLDYGVGTTNIDRADENYGDETGSGEILVSNNVETELPYFTTTNHSVESATKTTAGTTGGNMVEETTLDKSDTEAGEKESTTEQTTTTTTITTTQIPIKINPTMVPKLSTGGTALVQKTQFVSTTTNPTINVSTTTTTTIEPFRNNTTKKTFVNTTQHTPAPTAAHPKAPAPTIKEAIPASAINATTPKPAKQNGLITALLDGITDILSVEKVSNNKTMLKLETINNTHKQNGSAITTSIVQPVASSATSALPHFKPLPTVSKKSSTRINSKKPNFTTNPPLVTKQQTLNTTQPTNVTTSTLEPESAQLIKLPLISTPTPKITTPTTATTTVNSNTPTTTETSISTTTSKPLVIKTNPTILEAEPLEEDTKPTLPPSLPNLKIIPFLPTDAVEPDRTPYNKNPQISRIDYDLYDEAIRYPAITEGYPTYAEVDDNGKAEYIYNFNVEGPAAPVTSTSAKLDGKVGSTAFVKYDFGVVNGVPAMGFSPPTETEGGFVPKEPFVINDDAENASEELNYQVTKHIIDITTAEPMRENTTKIIEITTPDPFKDVIRTEPPPDLISLIEDKEHLLHAQKTALLAEKYHTKSNKSKVVAANPPTQSVATLGTTKPPNKNNVIDGQQQNKNTIKSLLDLLFKDEADEMGELEQAVAAVADVDSAMPQFKTLPEASIEDVPLDIISTTKKPIKTTTVGTTTIKPRKTTTTTMRTTTTKPARNKPVATTLRNKPKPKPVATTNNNLLKNNTVAGATLPGAALKGTKTKVNATRRVPTTKAPARPINITANKRVTTPSTTSSTSVRPTPIPTSSATSKKPLLLSPFDKLPFMNASYEIKPNTLPPQQSVQNNLLNAAADYKSSLNHLEGLEPAFERYPSPALYASITSTASSTSSTSTTTTSAPQHSSLSAQSAQHGNSNSLIDPTGILKLAGCNIYGRMYRVGRIILELSDACQECKCTETGVKCGKLDC